MKLITIVVGLCGFLGGVLAGFFLLPMTTFGNSAIGNASRQAVEQPPAREALGPGMIYPMKERVVNLADSGLAHYAKVELALEYEMPEAKNLKGEAYRKRQDDFSKEMSAWRPALEDIVTTVFAGRAAAEVSSAGGKERLRDELKGRFADVVSEHKLLNVYFTQLVIQ